VGDWETLLRLMPPTTENDTSVDWARLRESWGKEFPADYRQFIGLYGAGTAGTIGGYGYLVIEDPEPKGELRESATGGMLHETANAEYVWATVRKSPQLAGTSPELIAWGADASADILCWDASGEDPSTWPVLVYNRGDSLWRRYDCGMVAFLLRVLQADFDDCPLGGTDLWGNASVTFLTLREQQRLLKTGLDPWTGEPDPYAGMYPY
jgi:hypothetical protein